MDATELYSLQHAAFYDASHGSYVADCAFWIKMAKKNPGPLLELACGSGRIGLELIRAGLDYTGLDASEGMLSLFAKKWETLGRKGEPPFQQGDMRRFNLGRRFQLILITFNSLQHLHTDAEVLQAFDCCRGHLEKGGRFCFDVFNPDRRILDRDPSVRHPLPKFMDEARGLWCELSETNRYDEESRINRIEWFYRYENGEEGTFKLEMRQFFPQEMDALIGRAGFRILNKWGDFVNSGFSAASPRQVFECAIDH
jgi:SAM-dependent methyltransferase